MVAIFMMNKIIFTQDMPGERLWLKNKFLGYKSLETYASGLWPSKIPEYKDNNNLYEISYKDNEENLEWLKLDLPKVKSVYSINDYDCLFKSGFWSMSDSFISNLKFENTSYNNNFIILNLARSGTLFLQSILIKKLKEFTFHKSIGNYYENKDIVDQIKQNRLTVFFIYRNNAWDWCTSNVIAKKFGYYHYNNYPKDLFKPMQINQTDIDSFIDMQISTWNFWCNLKCYVPDLNCYLIEYSNLIKEYGGKTLHKAMPYSKQNIITNYNNMHEIFLDKYKNIFDTIMKNGSNHLKNMNCKTDMTDLDL